MKKREIIVYSLFFLLTTVLTVSIVARALTLNLGLSGFLVRQTKAVSLSSKCSDQTPLTGLAESLDPHLKKLAEYQEVCGSFATDKLMLFSAMPATADEAITMAKQMAGTLKEFSGRGVQPLVIVEPSSSQGQISFTQLKAGVYDTFLTSYFQTLRAEGVTDNQMGTWVPLPEANLPYWQREDTTPADFGLIVSKYLTTMKTVFPKAQGSVLLNSATYESTDFNWAEGDYQSLLPYVNSIQPGLVDSFGLQGFPWATVADQTGPGIFDAAEFLNATLAKEAAARLGVKTIWLNSGSFGRKYTLDQSKTVTISAGKRKDILAGILTEADKLKNQGFSVSINLFAEDKSNDAEATDWSYWSSKDNLQPDAAVFVEFANRTKENGIGLSLFAQ